MIAGRINQVATRKGHEKLNIKKRPQFQPTANESSIRKTKAAAVYEIVILRGA